MNEIMCVPNFNEGRLNYKIDTNDLHVILKVVEDYNSNQRINTKKLEDRKEMKYKLSEKYNLIIKTEIDYSIIQFFEICGVDLKRFIEDSTKKIKVKLWIEQNNLININGKEKFKKIKIYEKKFTLNLPTKVLRESAIEYLKFKLKSIQDDLPYINKKYPNLNLTPKLYLSQVKLLKNIFEYYSKTVNNSTLDETLNYTVHRLLESYGGEEALQKLQEEYKNKIKSKI